jgi:hypothetical protein
MELNTTLIIMIDDTFILQKKVNSSNIFAFSVDEEKFKKAMSLAFSVHRDYYDITICARKTNGAIPLDLIEKKKATLKLIHYACENFPDIVKGSYFSLKPLDMPICKINDN